MGYGAEIRRADAQGAKNITDVDIYTIGLLCETKRGIEGVAGEIYSFSDFIKKAGSFNESAFGAYVAKSFYDTLESGVNVEMKIVPYVATDALQATGDILNSAETPGAAFTLKAGYLGKADRSGFGNDIAYTVDRSSYYSYLLQADISTSATQARLFSIQHLEVGYIIHIDDSTNSEYAEITAIDPATKKISFSALTHEYSAAMTSITRVDWSLTIGVKNDQGTYDRVEGWDNVPFVQSDLKGMSQLVNDSVSGSKYIILNYTTSVSASIADSIPQKVTEWKALIGGSDGTPASQSDYSSLVDSFYDEDIFMLLAPELSSIAHNEAMLNFATDTYKCLYYGQAGFKASEESLKALGAALQGPYRFGMIPCDKWITVNDPLVTGTQKVIPAVGMAAAHYFNSYSRYGVGKVAAGNSYAVKTTAQIVDNGLIHDDGAGVGGRLIRDFGINICRYRQGRGITINSARSLSTNLGYIFQHQIAGFILYSRSIREYYKTVEQDQAGREARESHYRNVWTYMNRHYENGEFYKGEKDDGTETVFEDVVKIKNDATINTNLDIAQGIENAFIQYTMAPPIENPVAEFASAPVTMIG